MQAEVKQQSDTLDEPVCDTIVIIRLARLETLKISLQS